MSYNHPEIPTDLRTMTYRLDEVARQAHVRAQLRQAGIGQQAWLARQWRQVLNHVGHWLVAVGERLEQDVIPTTSV